MILTKFWTEVIEAFNQVSVTNDRIIKVERDGKSAVITADEEFGGQVVIAITTAQTQTVEPLIAP